MDNIDSLVDCGYSVPIVKTTTADKNSIVSSVSLHYAFLKCKPAIDQLKEGLHYNSGSLMKFVQEYPTMFERFFHGEAEPPSAGNTCRMCVFTCPIVIKSIICYWFTCMCIVDFM